MKKILRVDKIQKYYGNKDNLTKAIDGISFDVEEGEFILQFCKIKIPSMS